MQIPFSAIVAHPTLNNKSYLHGCASVVVFGIIIIVVSFFCSLTDGVEDCSSTPAILVFFVIIVVIDNYGTFCLSVVALFYHYETIHKDFIKELLNSNSIYESFTGIV